MQVIALLVYFSCRFQSNQNEIFFRVDTDGDGDIDEAELEKWIKIQIMDYVHRDAQQVKIEIEIDKGIELNSE